MDDSTDIDLTERFQTLHGPGGLKLELDASQIFPKDPGMGTPCLLYLNGETMTLGCAQDNSTDLGCDDEQTDWIWEIEAAADEWLDAQYRRIQG